MRISNDVFIPSVVKNDIYDILDEHIVVAGNEDVYDKEIVTEIIKLLDEHPKVNSIPCGWAESLSMILANTIATEEWDWDTIRQEVANDIDCYNALSNEPNIYVMCCVL